MRDYGVDDYGLVLNTNHLQILASRVLEDYSDEEWEIDKWGVIDAFADKVGVEYIGDFSGEAFTITDSGENDWSNSDVYSGDTIYYVPVSEYYTDNDAVDIAKVLYRECRGVPSVTEQACVAWTILNRVDNNNASIHDVVSSPHQFAFSENTPVDETLLNLAYDVLERWNSEKNGETNVGRVLPESYLWFEGHSGHNYFRNRYDGDFTVWSYSLESPYES